MLNKLYIGNLPASVTDADLKEMFRLFGTVVSASVAITHETGRSKRFGFVEMATSDEAQRAIDRLNLTQQDDTVISVSRAGARHRQ